MPGSSPPDAVRRVVLHIGLHKTATTYVQDLWRANQDQLAEQGIYYPAGPGTPLQRLAVYDLLGHRPQGVEDHRLPGQWQALADLVSASVHPTALLSDEGLSVATPKEATATVASFPDREVHVLVTCRDLGRVLVSAWQEDIKNDRTWTWEEYAEAVKDPSRRAQNPARGFWRRQDLPAILSSWRHAVQADRIHVVTLPPPGAPRDLLVDRIGAVVGFAPEGLTAQASWDNVSLGTAGTEVLRQLNERLDHRLNARQYGHTVKDVLVPYLVRHGKDAKYGLPAEELPWLKRLASEHVASIRTGGYDVVGDLEDLIPHLGPVERRPDQASVEEQLDHALLALTGLTERYATVWWQRRKDDQPEVEAGSRRVRMASAARGVSYRTRRYGADLADRNRLAARGMAIYLNVQGRRNRSGGGTSS